MWYRPAPNPYRTQRSLPCRRAPRWPTSSASWRWPARTATRSATVCITASPPDVPCWGWAGRRGPLRTPSSPLVTPTSGMTVGYGAASGGSILTSPSSAPPCPAPRHLCMQFAEEYQDLDPTDTACLKDHALLAGLRDELVCYLLQHNAEPEVATCGTHTPAPAPYPL